jgi:hypothetical protein
MNKHKIWEALVFSNTEVYGVDILTRVLDAFEDHAEANPNRNARDLIQNLLAQYAMVELQHAFRHTSSDNGGLRQHVYHNLVDMLCDPPKSIVDEAEEAVYDNLKYADDLPVEWSTKLASEQGG